MARALDSKHHAMVILKIGRVEEVVKERDIYVQLEGIPGIPIIYGWCVTDPMTSYISLEPFTEDLYEYVATNGAVCLRQACKVAGEVVSVNVLLFIQDQLRIFLFYS